MTALLPLLLLAAAPSPLETMGAQLEELAAKGDAAGLDALVDWPTLLERITGGLDTPKDFREGFGKGMRKASMFGAAMTQGVRGGGSVKLLRVVPAKSVVVLRVLDANGGFSYLSIETKDGKLVDLVSSTAGEAVSVLARRLYIRSSAEASQSVLERLQGKDRDFIEHAKDVTAFNAAVHDQKGAEAMKLYAALPMSVKKEKAIQLARLQAAMAVGDAEYARAIAEFQQYLPGDPSLDVVMIDGAFLKKDWALVHQLLGRVDQAYDDPYLDVLQATAWDLEGKPAKSKESLERALSREPTLAVAWDKALDAANAKQQYGEVAKLLDRAGAALSVDFRPTVAKQPTYAGFLASKEGKAWAKAKPKK